MIKSSLYRNNRQPYGSLSNVLRRPAVVEKGVGGDDGGVPSRGDTSLGADLRALGEEVDEK